MREERIIMCEYCNGDGSEHELFNDEGIYWFTKSFGDGTMYIYCQPKNSIISNGLRIMCCPMCGRKLENDNETTEQ